MLHLDGECAGIPTVEVPETTQYNNDKGPASEQTDPVDENYTTHSSVILTDAPVNIQAQVQNIVSDVLGETSTTNTLRLTRGVPVQYLGQLETVILFLNVQLLIFSHLLFHASFHMAVLISLQAELSLALLYLNGLTIFYGLKMVDLPIISTSSLSYTT